MPAAWVRLEHMEPLVFDELDAYRLLGGSVLDLSPARPEARVYLSDLALRLAQGQGYAELLARILRPDCPLYEGWSPLAPQAHELPALKAARDLVYRAGVAEGAIAPQGHVTPAAVLPLGLRGGSAPASDVRPPASTGLTTEAIVTVGEAMDMLGITRQAVINAVRSGRVRGEQHGKLWVLSREDVLRYRLVRDDRRALRREAEADDA